MEVFILQQKIIGIMKGARSRDSYRIFFFFNFRNITLNSSTIYSVTVFVVNNGEYITENSELYDIKTWNNRKLFQPHSNLSIKGVLIMLTSWYLIIFLLKICCQVILISLKNS
jgi:hypothetical protein